MWNPVSIRVFRFAAMPLALVNHIVTSSGHDRGNVRYVKRKLELERILRERHILLASVFESVLSGKETAHQGRPCWSTHAGIGKGVLEGKTMSLQTCQP